VNRSRSKPSWVYFARRRGDTDGPIRIGVSSAPGGLRWTVLAAMRGGHEEVRAIRALFGDAEWLTPTPELLAYVAHVRGTNGPALVAGKIGLFLALTREERRTFDALKAVMTVRGAREVTLADAVRRVISDQALGRTVVESLRGGAWRADPGVRPCHLYVQLTVQERGRIRALAAEAGVSVTRAILALAEKAAG
jgi:hypothetical protein